MRRRLLRGGGASLWLACRAAAQPALDSFDAVKASAEITDLSPGAISTRRRGGARG